MANPNFTVCFALLTGILFPFILGAEPQRLLYYVPNEDGWESLSANGRKISILAPQVFSVNGEGKVTGAVEQRLREPVRRYKIRVMPLLVNENFSPQVAHGILRDPSLRKQVIAEAVRLCRENGCWGLQLDFEAVPREDGQYFTLFVREASEACHKQRLRFSVAVPAQLLGEKRQPEKPGPAFGGFPLFQRSYDLKELSRYADFLSLMLYDHYTRETVPGPIAGYGWVEQNLRFVLQSVPRNKVFLGLGFFARRWCNQDVSESSYPKASEMALAAGAVIRWDAEQRSPWFEFDQPECHAVVWFENQKSLREKLKLVERYRLAGFSAWRLGQEDPAFWNDLR